MAKPKIDLDPVGPITFKRQIDIPTPSGKALQITWELKHRTRDEMAILGNSYAHKAYEIRTAAAESKEDDRPMDKEQALAQSAEVTNTDVELILDVACGWDVDGYAFTRENIFKLCQLYPATAGTVLRHYNTSMHEGRLGN